MRGVAADDGGAGGVTGGDMVMSFPSGGHQGSGDGDGGVSGKRYRTPEDRRKAKEVAEARGRRAREERASVARAAEAARCAEAVARREELLRVREACLPGLVFLTHEVGGLCFVFVPPRDGASSGVVQWVLISKIRRSELRCSMFSDAGSGRERFLTLEADPDVFRR